MLLFVHKDIKLSYGKIIDTYANMYPHRMTTKDLAYISIRIET